MIRRVCAWAKQRKQPVFQVNTASLYLVYAGEAGKVRKVLHNSSFQPIGAKVRDKLFKLKFASKDGSREEQNISIALSVRDVEQFRNYTLD